MEVIRISGCDFFSNIIKLNIAQIGQFIDMQLKVQREETHKLMNGENETLKTVLFPEIKALEKGVTQRLEKSRGCWCKIN